MFAPTDEDRWLSANDPDRMLHIASELESLGYGPDAHALRQQALARMRAQTPQERALINIVRQQELARPEARFRPPPPHLSRTLDVQGASTGWTTPTITYEKMRQMQAASAEPLNRDIDTHVGDPAFRASWDAWYQRAWLPFFDKYAGPHSSELAKLGAALHSDDIAARAESFRQQLEHFFQTYSQQRRPDNRPVPPPTGAPPLLGGLPEGAGKSGVSLPWWLWAGGAVVIGALGWFIVQKVRELNTIRRSLETDVVPGLLDATVPGLGRAYGKAKGRKNGAAT